MEAIIFYQQWQGDLADRFHTSAVEYQRIVQVLGDGERIQKRGRPRENQLSEFGCACGRYMNLQALLYKEGIQPSSLLPGLQSLKAELAVYCPRTLFSYSR